VGKDEGEVESGGEGAGFAVDCVRGLGVRTWGLLYNRE
jgi:hypothetical protein